MLNLSLATVSKGGQHAQWVIAPDDPLWEGAEVTLTEAVSVEVDARPVGDSGVFVRGRIRTTVEGGCRRCLAPVVATVDESIDLLFEELRADEADELAGEVYPLPGGDELDLGEPLREQLLLRVPEHFVCSEACRGLCAQCGADLNQAACECAPAEEPGPWDALKNIKFE